MNYKADDVGAPSIYGVDGTDTGPGILSKVNIAATSTTVDLDDKLIEKWMTICPLAAVNVRFGKTTDTLTAVATDMPLAAGEKFSWRVSKYTQSFAFIGGGATTNGLLHWMSENTRLLK